MAPADSPVLYVLVSAADYRIHKWWCVGVRRGARRRCFRFQGSAGFLQLSQCKWIITSQGAYTGNTKGPKSPLDHKHLHVCSLIPTLSLCLSLRSNSITLQVDCITVISPRILTQAWHPPSHVNTWLCPLIEPSTILLWDTTRLGERASRQAKSWVKCNSLLIQPSWINAGLGSVSHKISDYLPACCLTNHQNAAVSGLSAHWFVF